MFLALRELSFARARFALMGAVVALIAILMVLLSGLSVGLVNDGVSGLKKVPATSFAFADGVAHDAAFSRSVVDVDAVEAWREVDGVRDAAPYGNLLVNARSDAGVDIDLALFGVESDSFMAPEPTEGEPLGDAPTGVVVSETATDEGIEIGDTLTLAQVGTELTVVGVLEGQHTFGHVDVAYVPLRTWQEVKVGASPDDVAAGDLPERTYREVTAVAVRAADSADLAAADRAAGTESLALEESFGASPGYTAETSTLLLIQVFLYAIGALVVGAFFTVWTIQRSHELAVLRAMGAPTGYLLRDSLAQSLVLLVLATGVGVGIGVGAGALIGSTPMPFALDTGAITLAAVLLVVLGLAGSAVAALRVARIDPLTALGGHR
ncbi:ABC transporter permease [Nocardioides ferulae]|uniref:ABC transporter permease n=1 Tax=Nocardioides ferulae TaxID=2340821 RepID=UPI000EB4D821|nr:ABC transporter permease [Nocardioides ferulae]